MPLVAELDGKRVVSVSAADGLWESMRERSARKAGQGLSLPCCGARAVPTTSRRGLRHFAHHVRSGCAAEGESAEHMEIKAAVAAAVDAREGWRASVEDRAEDGSFVADVMARRGKAELAFEVQLSPLGDDEARERTDRYLRAGVLPVWLFRRRLRGSVPSVRGGLSLRLPAGVEATPSGDAEAARSAVAQALETVEIAARVCEGALAAGRASSGFESDPEVHFLGRVPWRVDLRMTAPDAVRSLACVAADLGRGAGVWTGRSGEADRRTFRTWRGPTPDLTASFHPLDVLDFAGGLFAPSVHGVPTPRVRGRDLAAWTRDYVATWPCVPDRFRRLTPYGRRQSLRDRGLETIEAEKVAHEIARINAESGDTAFDPADVRLVHLSRDGQPAVSFRFADGRVIDRTGRDLDPDPERYADTRAVSGGAAQDRN